MALIATPLNVFTLSRFVLGVSSGGDSTLATFTPKTPSARVNIIATIMATRTAPNRKLHSTITATDSDRALIPLKTISNENPPTSRSKKRKRYIMGKTKTPITIIPTAVAKLAKRMCSDIMPIPDDISVTLPLYTPPSKAAGIKSSTKISMPTPVGTQRLKRGGLFFMMNDEGNIDSRDNIPQPICFQPLPSYLQQVCGCPPLKDLQSRCVREYAAEF